MSGWSELEVDGATNGSLSMMKRDGCPGGSGIETSGNGGALDPTDACPRICPGDYNVPIHVSVGPAPNDVNTLPGTRDCHYEQEQNPNAPYRVNPPGPPESDAIVSHKTISVPDVTIGSALATNDNARLSKFNQPGGDTTSNGPGTVSWSGNAATQRVLTLNGTGDIGHRFTLSLGGRNYVLCKLKLTGTSQLLTLPTTSYSADAPNVSTKIYFDSPENCGLQDDTAQIDVEDDSNIASSNWDFFRTTPNPPGPGVLPLISMVGSKNLKTRVFIQTHTWYFPSKMMLYAPQTDITLSTWARENEGWFLGKTLEMRMGAEIESPPALGAVGIGVVPPDYIHYHQTQYLECGAPGATIDANC